MSESKPTAFLAYVPVLHQGYLDFFAKYPEVKTLYLLDESLIKAFRQLEKDIRALPTKVMKEAIASLDRFDEIKTVSKEMLGSFDKKENHFIIPDEDEMHDIVFDYLHDVQITWDTIFLRWDRKRSYNHVDLQPDVIISRDEFDLKLSEELDQSTKHSSDWWRQVAAALVKDKHVILRGINGHMPHDMQAYSDGDPRANFQSGEHIDLATSIHAESYVIAEAAKAGIKTEGCDIYSTTFPCPVCAKLIAQAGIKRVFYSEGYALLDGETVLKSKGVEIIKVEK
jgi:dCMP deaminase